MEQQSDTSIWPEARVAAFWDRPKLTYDKWLIAIFKGDARSEIMLKQSMLFMEVRHFVALIGVQRFIDHYPDWRKLLIDNDPRTWTRRGIMDSLWSWQVCGTIYMKNPTHEWFQLTKKQKATKKSRQPKEAGNCAHSGAPLRGCIAAGAARCSPLHPNPPNPKVKEAADETFQHVCLKLRHYCQ